MFGTSQFIDVKYVCRRCTEAVAVNGAEGDVLRSSAGRKVKVVRLRQSSVEDQGATEF